MVREVLDELVKPARDVKPEPVVKDEKTQKAAEKLEQINKNILEELTGNPREAKEDKPDKKQEG